MKILVIHNSYQERGGEDEAVASEMKMLERFGQKVISYTHRSNVDIQQFPILKKLLFFFKEVYWSPIIYKEIKTIIQRERPDVAHIHNTFLALTPSVYEACLNEKVPIVLSLHNYRFLCPIGTFFRQGHICHDCLKYGRFSAIKHRCWKNSYFLSWVIVGVVNRLHKKDFLLNSVTRFIALSSFSLKMFVKNGFPKEKFSLKTNCLHEDPGVGQQDGEYALFVGGLFTYKGVVVLIEAWNRLRQVIPLKVIGQGPLLEDLKRINKKANIEFLGRRPWEETMDYMKRALFLVFPSQCYEICPRVIIEAYACGVPVIASDIDSIKDFLVQDETGLLFRCGDALDLANKVENLLENRQKIREMKQKARKLYEEKYSLEENYSQLIHIYEEAMSSK